MKQVPTPSPASSLPTGSPRNAVDGAGGPPYRSGWPGPTPHCGRGQLIGLSEPRGLYVHRDPPSTDSPRAVRQVSLLGLQVQGRRCHCPIS